MGRLSLGSASWTVVAGHLLVLLAAVTGSVAPNTAIAAGVACSVLAVAVLLAAAPADAGGQRAVTALTAGHAVAGVVVVLGLVPAVPRATPLAGLGAGKATRGSLAPTPSVESIGLSPALARRLESRGKP